MTLNDDSALHQILTETRVIALVGASHKPERPSHRVAQYLRNQGYRVIPVNPGLAGQTLFGETVYASLTAIPGDIQVDMVDVFRRSEDALPVVQEAVTALPGLKAIWLQLGIRNDDAAAIARDAGIAFVQDRCTKIEHARLVADIV